MRRKFFEIFFILLFGALGGIIFQAFFLPYLATKPFFQRFQFVKILTEREVIINPKETTTITENVALEKAIEKVQRSIIFVKSETKMGKTLEGSGLILTSDGTLITLANLVPKESNFNFYWEGEKINFQFLKRDTEKNLALIKTSEKNMPTVGFVDFEKIKMGQRVFLIGIISENGKTKKMVNEGIIKSFDQDRIETNIIEKNNLSGSSLFNIEGELVGLVEVDKQGKVFAIPTKKIKEFSGF